MLWPTLLRHLSIQLGAALTAWFFIAPGMYPLAWCLLQGTLASLCACCLQQSAPARWLHLVSLPLLGGAWLLALPPWCYLLAFALTFSLSCNASLARVPLYLSSKEAVRTLADVIPPGARVLDAGSGDGRLALALARARPDVEVRALENAWGSCLLAYFRWRFAGCPRNLALCCQNFWRVNWQDFNVVYVFLSPEPMLNVWDKFLADGKPGDMLISNTFEIPAIEPQQRLPLSGRLQQALLIWRHDGTE